jgi:hypothetical protein
VHSLKGRSQETWAWLERRASEVIFGMDGCSDLALPQFGRHVREFIPLSVTESLSTQKVHLLTSPDCPRGTHHRNGGGDDPRRDRFRYGRGGRSIQRCLQGVSRKHDRQRIANLQITKGLLDKFGEDRVIDVS